MSKTAKKKPVRVKAGLEYHKSAKGISVHIHAKNGNKLAVLTGYNTRRSAQKGISAVHSVLIDAYNNGTYDVTDLTKKK